MTDKLTTMDAIKYLKHALTSSPSSLTVRIDKGMLQLALDEFEDAQRRANAWRKACKATQEANKDRTENSNRLAELHQKYGRDAMDVIESLVEALSEKNSNES